MLDPLYLITDADKDLIQTAFAFLQATVIQIGSIRLSFAAAAGLIFQIGLVIGLARVVKQIMKKQILKRFGLELGSRESLASLSSYGVTIAGFILVLDGAGINFGSLAVFAGFMGIALGLGFQTLANNFISGIIVLLEQPIRVGDFIEINTVKGTVEKISLRSTVIRTGRGLAVILPNSTFTSTQVINWSQQACCVALEIAVPDFNDPVLVTEALLAAARQEPAVLSTPIPQVFFKGIENNGFKFEMEIWIDQPRRAGSIKSSVYFLMQAKFQEYGISCHRDELVLRASNAEQFNAVVQQLQGNSDAPPMQLATNKKILRATAITLRDLLRKVSYFQNLSDIELRHIIEEGYQKRLPTNEVICRENDPGDCFYIILSGSVDVFVDSISKQVAVRSAGEFIGEMSLLLGTPRTATLRTLEETTLFVVDRGNLQNLLRRHQELADRISEELAQRQDTLEQLGIKISSAHKDETPFLQIRKRIQSIFGI